MTIRRSCALGAVDDKVSTYLLRDLNRVSQNGEILEVMLVMEGENANQCLGAERVAMGTV